MKTLHGARDRVVEKKSKMNYVAKERIMIEEIRILNLATLGRFNGGVPYIDMNVDGDLLSIFQRQIAGSTTLNDREYASTLFHEYIHQIQAALFYPMQVLFLCRQWQIYEIYKAGVETVQAGKTVLMPVEYSSEYQEKIKSKDSAWQAAYIGANKADSVGALELVEGVARILQEAYYGERENDTKRYTVTRSVAASMLGAGTLSMCELLDVCEVALRTENPGRAFYTLLLSLRGSLSTLRQGDFYVNVTNLACERGLQFAPDLSGEIVANIKRLFVSNIFAQLQNSMTRLYQGLQKLFEIPPVFSRLYSLTVASAKKDEGLFPYWFMIVLGNVGSPPIKNASGILEKLSHTAYSERDQTSIALEAVIDSVVARDKNVQCGMYNACVKSHLNGLNISPDAVCNNRPWDRVCVNGQVCPYQAVWKAMGLEGLKLTKG